MSQGLPAPTEQPAAQPPRAFLQWSVVGVVAVLLLFVLSVHAPESIKLPGLFPCGLGLLAGWGLGKWALAQRVSPTIRLALVAWLAIAAGEVLAAVKTNQDRVAYLKTLPMWQASPGDPVTEKMREALKHAPPEESDADRARRLEALADIERGEEVRRQRLKRLTFYGYLDDRLRRRGAAWPSPWPAVVWGAEIVTAATLGAWLTLHTARTGTPRP